MSLTLFVLKVPVQCSENLQYTVCHCFPCKTAPTQGWERVDNPIPPLNFRPFISQTGFLFLFSIRLHSQTWAYSNNYLQRNSYI